MTPDERRLELAWAAGIIQGEGCIDLHLHRQKRKIKSGKTREYSTLVSRVVVGQAEPDWEMLNRLQQLWGGYICGRRKQKKHYQSMKIWTIVSRKALRACEELCACPEFRGPKRAKAEEIIAFYRVMDANCDAT